MIIINLCWCKSRGRCGSVVASRTLLLSLFVCPCVSLPRHSAALHQRLPCHARTPLFAPHPHSACHSHISSSYFHGSSYKSSLPIPLRHHHQHPVDIGATTRGTYHPSAFTTPTRTVVVGSRCVYAYDRLPNIYRQTDFLAHHTSTTHRTQIIPVIFFLAF